LPINIIISNNQHKHHKNRLPACCNSLYKTDFEYKQFFAFVQIENRVEKIFIFQFFFLELLSDLTSSWPNIIMKTDQNRYTRLHNARRQFC
jgi:hypothetical protein